MTETTGIAVAGASGRMGRMLIQAIDENEASHLAGVTERPGHDWIDRDLGECLGGAPNGITVVDDLLEIVGHSHALVDFTSPEATVSNSALAAQARITHVIGTTGLEDEHLAKIAAAARHAIVVRAGNMSLGVNLLTVLTRKVAAALDMDFDIEIVEMHHKHKIDAPSGTALMLGKAAAEGRSVNLDEVSDRGRDGETGARKRGDIGFVSMRGGDVVGEHDVIFAGEGERIILRHIAGGRMIFAHGAIKAALWGQTQKPGEYTMLDVLGLD